jgi:hypothetical protein
VRTSDPAEPLAAVCQRVEGSTGYRLASARVRAGFARGHLLDLVLHLEQAPSSTDEAAQLAAELAVNGLLGERLADDWIGNIDVVPLTKGGPLRLVDSGSSAERAFPIGQLGHTVENAIEGLYQGMQSDGVSQSDREGWTLLESEPLEAPDPLLQGDLVYACTRLPEMLKCFLTGASFASCRFSPLGERFCYLKYRTDAKPEARVALRQALEDRLEGVLRSAGVGRLVGNGTGLGHCYIDLAVSDAKRAAVLLRELGQSERLPVESWLLFCDSEWRSEWVGVWDETPPPAAGSNQSIE